MRKAFIITVSLLTIFASLSGYAQVSRNSWNYSFGFAYPRFFSTDVMPQESNYGGFFAIQRYFSEQVSLRIMGSYQSMKGIIGSKNSHTFFYTNGMEVTDENMRTNILAGDIDLLFNLSPCSPVSPYIGAGIGAVSYTPDWPEDIVNPDAKTAYAGEINVILGSEWRLSNKWKIISELNFHVLDGKFDGIVDKNREGVLGSYSDSYFTLDAGFQYYFSKGEPSAYCELYEGIKTPAPQPEYPTLDEIQDIIKRYAARPAQIDYSRIEEIIKKYTDSISAATNTNWILYGVNFDKDKASIKPASYPVLDHAVEMLKENPNLKVEIRGFTDNTGPAAVNFKISEARANSVKDYLIKNGIDASRLTAVGYGESNPVADNSTEAGRRENRRIEFKVK